MLELSRCNRAEHVDPSALFLHLVGARMRRYAGIQSQLPRDSRSGTMVIGEIRVVSPVGSRGAVQHVAAANRRVADDEGLLVVRPEGEEDGSNQCAQNNQKE